MLAVILINVLLAVLVLGAIVGSHLWAVLSARSPQPQPQPQPQAAPPVRARSRRRRPQTAPMPRGAAAAR
jgi:hypothetical protein